MCHLDFYSLTMTMVYNRLNPLHGFKPYNGGYNVANRDYWAVLVGLGIGVFLIVKNYCMRSSRSSSNIAEHSNCYYIIPFFSGLTLHCLAIFASGFNRFRGRTKKMEESILGARNALSQFESAFSRLNWTSRKLHRESQNIQRIVVKNRHKIDLATQILQGATTGVISINMVLVKQIIGFVLNGYLLFYGCSSIVVALVPWSHYDTCSLLDLNDLLLGSNWISFLPSYVAFKEFEQNPSNNSLNSIVPCVSQAYADHIMVEIGSTIHKFISKLNTKVQGMSQVLGLSDIESQLPSAPNFFYDPTRCPENAIPIGDVPNIRNQKTFLIFLKLTLCLKVLAKFTCYQNHSSKTGSASCKGDPTKFITEALYDMAWAYTQTVQGLINVFPDLCNLTECTFVKDTFSDVVLHQCRSLKISINAIGFDRYGGFVISIGSKNVSRQRKEVFLGT
ncbi:hypothetical protein MKX01_042278 [Papaver californicum]|nr:hypothetical protein MKX01_042278 [Papaver californicum]